MKKAASKVRYFSEIAEISSTYNLGDITLYVRPYERTKRHKTEMGLGPHRYLKVVAVVVFSDL